MKAVRCSDLGSFDNVTVEEVDDPTPGPGEIVVAVDAAMVNFVDSLIVLGRYQFRPTGPFTPGVDVAGRVVAIGTDCSRFEVGDRVHGMSFLGGFAEKVAVPEHALRRTPDAITAEIACTTGTSYRTAIDSLVTSANLSAGDDVAILGAAGGVGSAAIGIAKALGARVIACASTPAKRDFCLSLGADDVLDYTTGDFKAALKECTAGGADIVLDLVGGDASEQALRATSHGGRFIVVGFASGTIPKIPLNLVLLKGSTISGYEIGDFEKHYPREAEVNRATLEALLGDKTVTPPITGRYALDDCAAALERAAHRDKLGITVLTVSSEPDD